MRCSLTCFLFALPLLAQNPRPAPQQAPIDALVQSYRSAYRNGKFDEAATARDQARALLGRIPADDPQFANWAQRVSQLYDEGGFTLQGRDVLEQALARGGGLPESSPARVALLDAIARSWEQDRNLLKAASYLEQAVTAAEAQPQQPAQGQPAGFQAQFGVVTGAFSVSGLSTIPVMANRVTAFSNGVSYRYINNEDLYRRLFSLYRQLGRPEDAAAVLARIAAHVKNSDGLLASLYQQQGEIDQAAAIYKREAEDPQQAASALQSLANLYQSVQRYGEAATAMRQAIAKVEAPGDANAAQSAAWMRQQLANILQQAGQVQAADEVYRQLISEPAAGQPNQRIGIVTSYANFLAQTNRAPQAETLLQDYQQSHPAAEPWERQNLMYALANVERQSGKPQLADEYQRRANANQPQMQQTEEAGIGGAMRHAVEMAMAGKLDEAFNLTVQALESAPAAPDREIAPEQAFQVASVLSRKAPAQADEIYRRTLALTDGWSVATVTHLSNAQQNYARFLQGQKRWSEFGQAVESYRATLTAARGAGTGWLQDALRLRADVLYQPERRQDAVAASQDSVKLEESLSGATSEPYLRATETLANAMEVSGDRAGAFPLRVKAVSIAGLVYGSNDFRRVATRINAAMALANARQFDDAERLAGEAIDLSQRMQPRQTGNIANVLQQILQMKKAAQPSPAPKQ